jgi:biopolymer transport protein TolQ
LNGIDVIEILRHASPVTYAILAILLLFSVWSWGIILSKALLFGKINKEADQFWRIFRRGKNVSEISTALEALHFTPLVQVFQAAAERSGKASARTLQLTVQRTAAAQLTRLENRLNFLATTASVTPFIGLLGTVWGVMTSFTALGNVETASLKAVAPGMAEALIATAAGLFAAIPAVIAYNSFVYKLRNLSGQLDELQAELLASVEEERTTV